MHTLLLKFRENEDVMKRRKIFVFVLLLSLFPLSCASNQGSKQVLLGAERIVELYVPGCGG